MKDPKNYNIRPNSKAYWDFVNNLPPLSPYLQEMIIGLLLGDANAQTRNNGKTYSLRFEYGSMHEEYIKHIHNLLTAYCLQGPVQGKREGNFSFRTVASSHFNYQGELFYPEGVKCVPAGLITNYQTPVSLAYWWMDDGGKLDYTPSRSHGIVFNTHSFTIPEVDTMITELQAKFNQPCYRKINKGLPIIALSAKHYSQFMALVDPHIIPAMRYKLPRGGS